jgi:hypothetical protein
MNVAIRLVRHVLGTVQETHLLRETAEGEGIILAEQALVWVDLEAFESVAYAQLGEIQKACERALQALSLTKQTKSQMVLERIRRVCTELERWKVALLCEYGICEYGVRILHEPERYPSPLMVPWDEVL